MRLGELVFRLGSHRDDDRDAEDDSFALYKTELLVKQYARFFDSRADFRPRRIVELGIWQGGSLAFWNEIFQPEKLVGIDIADRENSSFFRDFVRARGLSERLKTFWRTDQADAASVQSVVETELGGEIDLVIDDCSHRYDLTKASFETLFPYLKPGGLYIIEDWAWAYWEEFREPGRTKPERDNLATLVFELTKATGTSPRSRDLPAIANVSVFQGFVAVERDRGGVRTTVALEAHPLQPETKARSELPRAIAFYLPQFHPIPENDAWWGSGFTEWRNVAKARPRFPGHYQPRLPADLGFYDLRLPEVRREQADLARAHGIYGFCYYHYWFEGKRLLDRPFLEVLATGEPDFPFCLCWANENWTRAWDGRDDDVLIEQRYSREDDRRHVRALARAFRHESYIRVDGKPLFLVYRIAGLPDPSRTAEVFREEAKKLGIGELYLATVESLEGDRVDPAKHGFDAAVEFQPDWLRLDVPSRQLEGGQLVYDYEHIVERMLQKEEPSYKRFPCVAPGWDNSPRRNEGAIVIDGSTPELYEAWLREVVARTRRTRQELVFINAWNEWAEGAHLEPCQKWGRAYLEATRNALTGPATTRHAPRRPAAAESRPAVSVCIPAHNGAAFLQASLDSVLRQTSRDFELIVVDDASSDGTEDCVRAINDKRIRYHRNSERLGLAANWNRCLELATAPYITVFHQDDVMLQENLERKAAVLRENTSVGMVYSNVQQIGPEDEVISNWWVDEPQTSDAGAQTGREFFEKLFWGPNIVCCPSVMMRRECYEKLGGFDESLSFTADWEMWMRIALTYDVAYLPETLVRYRRHGQNETERFLGARGLEQYYLAKKRILDKHPDGIGDVRALRSALIRNYVDEAVREAKGHWELGELQEASEYLSFAAGLRNGAGKDTLSLLADALEGTAPTVNGFSGERLAAALSTRKLFKTACFKLAGHSRFRWLQRFRALGKRILPG